MTVNDYETENYNHGICTTDKEREFSLPDQISPLQFSIIQLLLPTLFITISKFLSCLISQRLVIKTFPIQIESTTWTNFFPFRLPCVLSLWNILGGKKRWSNLLHLIADFCPVYLFLRKTGSKSPIPFSF